jgi:hypothetical protein
MRKKSSVGLEINVSAECRDVELRIIFFRIGEIDTLNEKFFAEILLEAKWQEPKVHTEFDTRPMKIMNTGVFLKEEKQLFQPNRYWNPKIYVENILSEPNETITYKIKREMKVTNNNSNSFNKTSAAGDSQSTTTTTTQAATTAVVGGGSEDTLGAGGGLHFLYWIYEYRKIKGYFFEKLDLKYFPVDIQNMSVTVTSYRSNREINFVPNKTRPSIVNSKINIDNNIW